MTAIRSTLVAIAVGIALIAAWPGHGIDADAQTSTASAPAAPDFTGIDHWFNAPPQSLKDPHGKVVLVEFWTHGCINCLHVVPHTQALYEKYAKDGLVVVGVHTPEYEEERDLGRVRGAIRELGITYPVAVDNENRTWEAYGNRFWPALYLIDQSGRVVYRHFGEGDYDVTEDRIRQLLGKA